MKDTLDIILDDNELLPFRKRLKKFLEKEGFDAGFRVQVQFWGGANEGNIPPVITLLDEIEEGKCEYCGVRTDRSIPDLQRNQYPFQNYMFICATCEGKLNGEKGGGLDG